MWIVKSNVSSAPVGPSLERNKFHACFSLTKSLCSKPEGNRFWRLRCHSLCALRCNMKLETRAVFCATWMCVTLTESWGDRTCSVVVIWTRCWRNTVVVIKHASRVNTREENTREGRKEKRGILSLPISLARVISPAQSVVPRCVFCRLSFQWASCAFTLHRRPQVFQVSNYGALQV